MATGAQSLPDYCVFCEGYMWPDDLPSEALPDFVSTSVPYVLTQSLYSVAIVGLGALTPGYILLVPKRHCLSIAELSEAEFSDFCSLKATIAAHINRLYDHAIFFEHGSATECASAGACVAHAHMHALPTPGIEFRAHMPPEMEEIPMSSTAHLRQIAQREEPYLFLEEASGQQFIFPVRASIESQFCRKIWAASLSLPERYDWALFPEFNNMLTTYQNFRSDAAREHKSTLRIKH